MKLQFKGLAITTAVLLTISLVFNIVLAVSGETYNPGSDQDPLVSKSYVDSSVSGVTSSLQILQGQYVPLQASYDALKKSFDDLSAKSAAQDQSIKALQDALKTAGTKPAAGGTTAQPQNPSSTTASGKGAANVANLNVRSQANTTSTSLAKLAKGESVTILSKSGDWYKIMTSKSKTGWVLGKLITIKK